MIEMPIVDTAKCKGCGFCVDICYCGALKMVGNTLTIIETEECNWCTYCEVVCPTGALSCPFEIVFEEA